MIIISCAVGAGLFGLLTRFWSPASALATLLILAIMFRFLLA
jgi:hypothetical protein